MKQKDRVNISEASRVLAVSEQALRQWTDEGKIEAFITPGGHRRYSRVELKRFISQNKKKLGMKDLVTDLEHVVPVLHDTATDYLRSTSWQGQLDSESQKYLASLGRHLLELIIKNVSKVSLQAETSKEVQEVGADFGRILARQGLPLTDAVQTFTRHRDPIIKVATEMLKKREGFDRRIVEAIPMVNNAMDDALISLVTAYQQQQSTVRKKQEGKLV
ncbi:MAG: helix-turn-helix domain-containing protein [Dehalococcoidales bacterium]|nr:helix-turn-helix domain-containing protein [Dehalococcoidales bacterium]